MDRKYIKFLAKMECENKTKRKRNLAELKELSMEELNDMWPGWTHKNIIDLFLDVYAYILKAEAKGVKRENSRLYTHSLLAESWITKQLNVWYSDGTLTEAEKEKIKEPLFDVDMTW